MGYRGKRRCIFTVQQASCEVSFCQQARPLKARSFMMLVTIIGSVAALCTTVALLPQAIQTIKTRATDDLSLPTYLLLFCGTILWGIYAVMIKDVPILITNVISLVLSSIILYLKVTSKSRRGPAPR
jgi:MtN3 and saliva related transmembrane protein